jgi:hypothetical protein
MLLTMRLRTANIPIERGSNDRHNPDPVKPVERDTAAQDVDRLSRLRRIRVEGGIFLAPQRLGLADSVVEADAAHGRDESEGEVLLSDAAGWRGGTITQPGLDAP